MSQAIGQSTRRTVISAQPAGAISMTAKECCEHPHFHGEPMEGDEPHHLRGDKAAVRRTARQHRYCALPSRWPDASMPGQRHLSHPQPDRQPICSLFPDGHTLANVNGDDDPLAD